MRHFIERITRIIKWIPVLWKIYDFDWTSVVHVLLFQIQRLRHVLENDSYHKLSKKSMRKMKTCENLLKRLIEDDYIFNAYVNHDKKWGEIDWVLGESNGIGREVILFRPNANTPELKEQERQEFRRLMDKPNEQQRQDLELFAKLFSKHVLGWRS